MPGWPGAGAVAVASVVVSVELDGAAGVVEVVVSVELGAAAGVVEVVVSVEPGAAAAVVVATGGNVIAEAVSGLADVVVICTAVSGAGREWAARRNCCVGNARSRFRPGRRPRNADAGRRERLRASRSACRGSGRDGLPDHSPPRGLRRPPQDA